MSVADAQAPILHGCQRSELGSFFIWLPQRGYRPLHPHPTWQICRTDLRPHTSTDSRHTAGTSLASRAFRSAYLPLVPSLPVAYGP